jgi:hypothetical protein
MGVAQKAKGCGFLITRMPLIGTKHEEPLRRGFSFAKGVFCGALSPAFASGTLVGRIRY